MDIVGKNFGLSLKQAEAFTGVAMAGLDREWPYRVGFTFITAADMVVPRLHHPVFYGHYDWHSSVHGHWTLVRLLRLFPQHAQAAEVRAALDGRFTAEGLLGEADFLRRNTGFERMYGWAWAMRLGVELRSWDDGDGKKWAEYFRPVEEVIAGLVAEYLPRLEWPVRCGVHSESGFALGQLHDWAVAVGAEALRVQIEAKARAFYGRDRMYPVWYEPSGQDFFSACLNVADLMRRVMKGGEYRDWLDGYLPDLAKGEAGNLLEPAHVSDLCDAQIVHLVGLNLSRAWTMRGVASVLAADDARREVLESSALLHAQAGLAQAVSGHYEGDHWLASFAVYLMSGVGMD